MTAVDFHTGVPDKLGYACRLLRKAYRAGNRVLVAGAPEQLNRLDSLLWTFEVGEFIPHGRLRAGQQVPAAAARTPIWLVDIAEPLAPAEPIAAAVLQADVLVNLGPGLAAGYARFARVIEIVADAPADDVAAGRLRWRQYLAAGHPPTNRTAAAA